MWKHMSFILALSMMTVSVHAADEEKLTQPMQMGDVRMSCDALVSEASAMEQIIGGSPEGSILASDAATGIATELAVRSGAYKAVGAIGAVGGVFKGIGNRKKKEREEQKKIAEQRWYYVVGLYQGRQCDSPPPQQ